MATTVTLPDHVTISVQKLTCSNDLGLVEALPALVSRLELPDHFSQLVRR